MTTKVVAVAVCCGEVDAAEVFTDAGIAKVWASGFSAGANAFGGDECSVYLLGFDEDDSEELDERSDYVRAEVEKARVRALAEDAAS